MLGGRPQLEDIYSLGVEPELIPDPGNAGAIEVSRSGYCELTTTAAQTRTLADPTFRGQIIDFVFIVDAGDCVITAASAINQTGNNTLTFSDIGEHIRLVGAYNATDGWEWKVIANDGVVLSTV